MEVPAPEQPDGQGSAAVCADASQLKQQGQLKAGLGQ